GGLEGPEGAEDRVEEEQEDQGAIVVEMERAVAGPVTLAADVMEPLEERQQPIEVLEPLEFKSSERAVVGGLGHAISPPGWQSLCLAEPIAQNLCRTDVLYPSIAGRAGHRCEYCRAPEAIFNFPFEVEHIIPVSRGGSDDPSNLAPSCR